MTQREFRSMSIRDVKWRIVEEHKRENRMLERQAQLACWLINSKRKKKDHIVPSQLVRFAPPKRRAADTDG